MAITIYLNGKKEEIETGVSIFRLLEIKNIRPEVVVVELNEKVIDRDKYPDTLLSAGDKVEFVYYMGGGIH